MRATSPDEAQLNKHQNSARLTDVQVWLMTGNLCERLSQLWGRQMLSVNPKKIILAFLFPGSDI